MTDSTIEDRIAARIARVAGARDQVIRTLIDDLKTSIRGAELGGELANPLERRALEVLERAFPAYVAPFGFEEGGRGRITPEVRAMLETYFGRPTRTEELRLMPYVLHCAINERKLDPGKVSVVERAVLAKWREAGLIEGGAGGLKIDAGFFRFIGEVLLLAYVDFDGEGVIAPGSN
jgi:hypothetical protein